MGAIAVPTVSDCLTDIAEVVVVHTLALAWYLVAEKYGTPSGAIAERVSGFAVIGYGKLGGRGLGHGSNNEDGALRAFSAVLASRFRADYLDGDHPGSETSLTQTCEECGVLPIATNVRPAGNNETSEST